METNFQKSIIKCIIASCNSPNDSPIRLFQFPSDQFTYDQWIESCDLERNMVKSTARVCERHFDADCFGKVGLKPGSVPTLNLSLLTPLNADIFVKNTNDHLPSLTWQTSSSMSTVNMNQSCLATDSPTSTSRTFSDHPVDKRPIENEIAGVDNNHKISKELVQESETESGRSIDFVFCKLLTETETMKKLSATKKDHRIAGAKCIIGSCGRGYRNSSKESPVTLFRFPTDPVLFDKWIESCQLDRNMIRKTSRVCARHFEPRCIGNLRLKPGTVPTLIHSILKPLDACISGKNNNDDDLPPLLWKTSPLRSTLNMNPSCLVTDSPRSSVTSTNPFSENNVENKPIENRMTSKGIKVADEDNNNERIISIDFEQEAQTETADDDPLQINKCDDNVLSGNNVDKNGTENRMKITLVKLADLQYKKSNDLEKESETDTSEGNGLNNNNNESNDKEISEDGKNIDAHASRKDMRRSGLKCLISSCGCGYRNTSKESSIRLFSFPKNKFFFDKWAEVCNIDKNVYKPKARVCERHFEAKFFGKRKLKANAIPTLNINPSNSGTCDENLFSGNSATNKQTENSLNAKRVKQAHVDNNKEISNELEKDSDTDTSDVDPFECSESNDIEICEAEDKNESSANHEHKQKSNGKCIIASCRFGNIESSTDFPVRLFSFPSYLLFFNKWVEACNLDRMIVKRTSLICERHFEAQWLGKHGLNNEAIPTLNLSDHSVLTPLNARTCDENSFLRHSLDKKSIENSLKSNNHKNNDNNTKPAVTPDKDTLENTEYIDIERCSNCIEKEEQYNKGKIRYNNLRKVIARAKRQPVRKPNFLHLIANMSHVSPEAKAICTMLLKRSNKFTPTQKVIAQNIRFYSSSTYKYLRNVLHLNMPSERCLDRWAVRFGSGFSPDLRDTHSCKKVP
ncbi:uncharacterized protein LOC117590036 isoform X1 [Drosophila guanche]|uniref:uncharacterized protein LOC117590036 isoform X1 n=1 Tax=Drosophila guanche TaxID=7266 RepID=UPI001472344B|nr:uncharacterized protein LOC117590036 isoform X1 [Drosophila guanche]XP_034138233.1 uncharacterized protein LOC117590036 isoform X1 [Drosophila guanche]